MIAKYDTAEDLIIKLKKLAKKIEQSCARFEEPEIITRGQFRIIFPMIKDGKDYSMQELTEMIGVDKALVSRTIADLESKGMVERDKKIDSSERSYKIMLSEKAKEFFAKRREMFREISHEMLNGVTFEEMLAFISVLDRLTEKN